MITAKTMPMSGGSIWKNVCNALIPPAEAPIPAMVNAWLSDEGSFAAFLGEDACFSLFLVTIPIWRGGLSSEGVS